MRSIQVGIVLSTLMIWQQNASAAESLFSEDQICKAGIAIVMGRDPGTMITETTSPGVTLVSYVRQNDGSLFTYKCQIEGNQILWGNETGRWRDSSDDSIITFTVAGASLLVKDQFSDGSASEESFTETQLGN